MYGSSSIYVATLCCLMAYTAPSRATEQQGRAPVSGGHVSAAAVTKNPSHVDIVDGFGHAVSNGHLSQLSGGSSVTENQTVNGTVANDSASQLVTGSNSISGEAFSGATGLPTVIQNSGNNVLIQNATIVNVQFKQ